MADVRAMHTLELTACTRVLEYRNSKCTLRVFVPSIDKVNAPDSTDTTLLKSRLISWRLLINPEKEYDRPK